jgi:hypothetical protein
MSDTGRKSGYDFCDKNMPNVLSWREISLLGRNRPTETAP